MRQLSAREFHQIAGRAGRAGYDTSGTVTLQAPEHEIDNLKQIERAGDDPKKKRKIVRKKAPDGFVSWGEPSFRKLIDAVPEPLTSHMQITHAMLLNVIARGGDAFAEVRALIFDNHESRARQYDMARQAISIYRTLRTAEVVEQTADPAGGPPTIRLTVDLQPNFALNQPLSPFALATFDVLDVESPTYALDMVSVVESTLDDPRPILSQQQFKARGEAVAAMKSEGIEYDQRMELLESVTHPKPLDELLTALFETYKASQPWIGDFELRPKSVVRDLYERAMTFGDYVNFYGLARSEGLVLRYLSDAFRALRQTIPDEAKTDELSDLIEWLGELVRQVDSSLLDEWEEMLNPRDVEANDAIVPPVLRRFTANDRAFRIAVRNEMFRRVQLMALDDAEALGQLDAGSGWDTDRWGAALDRYFDEYDSIGTDTEARGPHLLQIEQLPTVWRVRQILADPEGDHDFGISAIVDLASSDERGEAVVTVTAVGPASEATRATPVEE